MTYSFSHRIALRTALLVYFLGKCDCGQLVSGSKIQGIQIAQKLVMDVRSGDTECLYENLEAGAELFAMVKVLEIGRLIGFQVGFVEGNTPIVYPLSYLQEHQYSVHVDSTADYEFCIENANFVWQTTRVDFALVAYDSDKYANYMANVTAEQEGIEHLAQNISSSYIKIWERIVKMGLYLGHQRQHESKNWRVLSAQADYVDNWSMFQSVAIIVSGMVQIVIYRKMFQASGITSTGKVRA